MKVTADCGKCHRPVVLSAEKVRGTPRCPYYGSTLHRVAIPAALEGGETAGCPRREARPLVTGTAGAAHRKFKRGWVGRTSARWGCFGGIGGVLWVRRADGPLPQSRGGGPGGGPKCVGGTGQWNRYSTRRTIRLLFLGCAIGDAGYRPIPVEAC